MAAARARCSVVRRFRTSPGFRQARIDSCPTSALLAAPETGAFVRVDGHNQQIGGTSLSAPVWAGFCALINEARTKANKPSLPFLNPLIYPLMGGSSNSFRDVLDGNISNGGFTAGPGYDQVTGIGVPHVKNLIIELTK